MPARLSGGFGTGLLLRDVVRIMPFQCSQAPGEAGGLTCFGADLRRAVRIARLCGTPFFRFLPCVVLTTGEKKITI